MTELRAPRNLRLVKTGTRGRQNAVPLYPEYVGLDDEGRHLFEVTITRDEADDPKAHFFADEMPKDVDVRVRVVPPQVCSECGRRMED